MQQNLFGEIAKPKSEVVPITVEIAFTIENGGKSLHWDGKAYPNVSSGCMFGGATSYTGIEQINRICRQQKEWFEWYERPVKVKRTIRNSGNKEHSCNPILSCE